MYNKIRRLKQKERKVFMQLNKNLENIRKKAKETQSKIAEILNTTQQQYSKYEKGIQEIPVRHIITLAKHYNITTDELLGIKRTETIITEEIKELIKLYSKLNDKRKGKAELYIEQLVEQQEEEKAQTKETA